MKVRSATANRKKNRNVKQKRSRKSMNRTVFCQPDVPKDNWNIRSHENGVFSSNRAGISKKFNSVDSDEFIRAWSEEQHVIWMNVMRSYAQHTSHKRQNAGTNARTILNARPM